MFQSIFIYSSILTSISTYPSLTSTKQVVHSSSPSAPTVLTNAKSALYLRKKEGKKERKMERKKERMKERMKEKKKERKGRNEIDSYYVIYSSMRAAAAAVGNTTHTTNTHTTTMLTHTLLSSTAQVLSRTQ